MKKPVVIGSGKKSFFEEHKTLLEQLLKKIKEVKNLFYKKKPNEKKTPQLTLNNIEEIYEHIIQIYYNGYRIKKVNDKWVFAEDSANGEIKTNKEVKFESNGNLSVRIQDGAHQKMLCFTVDSKLRLKKN